jgi:hypothetical protein
MFIWCLDLGIWIFERPPRSKILVCRVSRHRTSPDWGAVDTDTLSLWTSRPMKSITVVMGVCFLSGSAMALSSSVLFESPDKPGRRHTPRLGNPRLQPELNTHSLFTPRQKV